MAARIALVYGGAGALGRIIVSHLKALGNWKVTSIDLRANADAHANVTLPEGSREASWSETAKHIESALIAEQQSKVDAVVCVAGGWCGGNAAADDFIQACQVSANQSVQSSAIAAHLAAKHLRENGLLVLTGANAALEPTPGMIGYGMAKAAVHHLIKSLGDPDGGLPKGARAVGVLPVTLDTPMNRKFMPNADHSTWTPLDTLAQQIGQWACQPADLTSGTLFSVITKSGKTEFKPSK